MPVNMPFVMYVHAAANLEFLKSCDLENRETGERIDLISKVMGSISNPEIRRMELMNTIAGIERYAAAEGDGDVYHADRAVKVSPDTSSRKRRK